MSVRGNYGVSLLLFLFFSALTGVCPQSCTLPETLRGRNMTSNAVGAVTIAESAIILEEGLRDCTKLLCKDQLYTALTFDCKENQGDIYLFRSRGFQHKGSTIYFYMCWYFSQQLSDQKWVYYQAPKVASEHYNSYVTAYTPPSPLPVPNFATVCDLGSPLPVNRYSLLLDTDSLASQSSSCPDGLLATFNAKQASKPCVSEFDVCTTATRQTILVSDPTCLTDALFSVDGKMDCLHSLSENDVTYVTTFTPESSSMTFACMAYVEDGGNVYVTLQESTCNGLQTPTSSTYDVSLEPTVLCPFPCTFPTDLWGTWVDSRKAQEVTFDNTTLSNFFSCSDPTCSGAVDLLDCYRTEDSRFLVRTPVTTVNSETVRVYVCLQLTQLSSIKYLYYQLHENLHDTLNDYVVTFNSGQSVSLSQACGDLSSSPYPGTRHHIFVKSGSETSSFSTCPDGLVGEFNNADAACQSTYDTCDDNTQLKVVGTACTPKPFFSDGGSLGCLHSVTVSDTTYVTLYNTDASPNGTSTFAFTCVAFKTDGITLDLSQNPLQCVDSQTPDNITTDNGALVVYQKTGSCNPPCTFPSALSGSWVNSRTAGEVTVTGGDLSDFFTCGDPPCSTPVTSLQCYIADSTRYLLRSPIVTIDGQSVYIYMCLELTELSSTKFLYYQLHQNLDPTLLDYVVTFPYSESVTIAQACEDLSGGTYKGTRHHVLLKSGEEQSSFSKCPEGLLGEFNNTDNKCESKYKTCDDDTQLTVMGTACSPKPFFSDGGSLGCLHSVTVSGTTYATLYNTDASPDGISTFPFTCVALELSDSTLKLSQNPLECQDTQTSSSITSDLGTLFTYKQTGDCSSEIDFIIIIIVVVVLLIIIVIIAIVIFCICRKKRAAKRRKDQEEGDAILTKEQREEDEERGSNLSIDSGYPHSSLRGDSRTGRGGRASRGTPRSHFAEMYEVAEEDPKQVNVIGHRHRRRRRRGPGPRGKGVEEAYESDGQAEYSDDSWEEYVDEDGNTQVRPRRHRQRRRKKVKQKYTRTHVLADGTTVEEEVESEYSVTASSDVTSSEDDRESLTDQIRDEKERRRARLDKIMAGSAGMATVIVTRDMDEKSHQPEKKRSFFNRLRRRARDRKNQQQTKEQNRGMFQKEAGKAEVPGVTGVEREIPYLLQYQKKKEIERTLNDEGFFEDPNEKLTAETVFGFHTSDRVLSPKSRYMDAVREADEERMTTATDSSQSDPRPRSRDASDAVNEAFAGEGEGDAVVVAKKDKNRHVTIGHTHSSSPTPSSDSSEMKEDSSGRKSSDTSSGVADLSPSHQPSSPEQNHASFADGSAKDSRRVSMGWDKVHGLYARHRLSVHGGGHGGREKEGTEGRGTGSRVGHGKSKQKQDKRVKTALRRLLNERLFGSSDKKKSRRGDDVTGDSWTNADSIDNNVSVLSSVAGTRTGTRQTARPLTQGKVAFAELDSDHSDSRGHTQGAEKRNGLSPARRFKDPDGHPTDDDHDEESDKNGQERLPTRGCSRLPPLRTPTMSLDRVFTPANYPKWELCVTASQRTMLVDGLQRDRTFLSRMQARTAWSSKTEDGLILPPSSSGTGKEEDTTDDESYLDPHRPDTEEKGKENEGEEAWAQRRAPPPRGRDTNGRSVTCTKASGRSPLDMDDRRLRRLLEELYKDKKYMDKLINTIDEDHSEFPDHMAAEDVKFLSEFGRQYLLDRAQYWELHGPLGPPRPPTTALGMRLSRAQTSMTSEALHHTSDENMTSPRPRTVR